MNEWLIYLPSQFAENTGGSLNTDRTWWPLYFSTTWCIRFLKHLISRFHIKRTQFFQSQIRLVWCWRQRRNKILKWLLLKLELFYEPHNRVLIYSPTSKKVSSTNMTTVFCTWENGKKKKKTASLALRYPCQVLHMLSKTFSTSLNTEIFLQIKFGHQVK
jgi:hypothetical protein